jgi:hypothetical protein
MRFVPERLHEDEEFEEQDRQGTHSFEKGLEVLEDAVPA